MLFVLSVLVIHAVTQSASQMEHVLCSPLVLTRERPRSTVLWIIDPLYLID